MLTDNRLRVALMGGMHEKVLQHCEQQAARVRELEAAIEAAPHHSACHSHRRYCSVCGVNDEDHAFFNDGRANPCRAGIYEQKTPCNCWKSKVRTNAIYK